MAGNSDDTTWLDATAQADLVRSGQASPVELVDGAIARVEALNPQLDAVIRTRFDQAREEARGTLPDGPFRGVPFLLKDLGSDGIGGDAGKFVLVEHFRAAGLVVLGRTNVPEFGTTVTTEPKSFPPARNPWNREHSTGGSSGGSAAAVASGMVSVAHGNDGGGSIYLASGEERQEEIVRMRARQRPTLDDDRDAARKVSDAPEQLRDRQAAHQGHQGRRLQEGGDRDGLQAARRRPGALAALQRPRARRRRARRRT